MNRFFAWSIAAILGCAGLLAGCDTPPDPIKTPDGKVITAVQVQADDPVEVAAVNTAERDRADYEFCLTVLKDFYFHVGNMDKFAQAEKELKNLQEAQYFHFLGVEVTPPKSESLEGADERLLVEQTLSARNEWLGALDRLHDYYQSKNNTFNARLIENVKQRLSPVHQYTYFLEAEIPGPQLRPTDVIPEADGLYDRAMKIREDLKNPLGFFDTKKYEKSREALTLFRELVQKYPSSTKIALSAYYIAEIYREYYNEYVRAVKWYERAWQWDPHVTEPARFEEAVTYEKYLHDPTHAVPLYRRVVKGEDPFRSLNKEYAEGRLEEITGKKN